MDSGGDFNNIFCYYERVGFFVSVNEFCDFKECLGYCGLLDLKLKFLVWLIEFYVMKNGIEVFFDSMIDFFFEGMFVYILVMVILKGNI